MKPLLNNILFAILKISNFLHVRIHLRLSAILKTSNKMVFEVVFQLGSVPTAVMPGNHSFLQKSIIQNRKSFITQRKHMIFW